MSTLSGKWALVTGATAGLGLAVAESLAAAGANLVVHDLAAPRDVADILKSRFGVDTISIAADLSCRTAIEAMMGDLLARLDGIDILVNNAGVITMDKIVDVTPEDWDFVMDVNAKGVFLCMRATVPGMLERGGGQIVSVASQAGKRGYKLFAHYCASKAAVILLTKGLALEVAPTIRVNCVCPGIVNTEMMDREYVWEEEMTGEKQESIKERWMSGIPMGRFQEPEHVAGVVQFLASDAASEMTGQAINITGGMVME
jgi:NAD(P)-dependent dehydrogenase (short-subunit alcohol dehydrogenase family)